MTTNQKIVIAAVLGFVIGFGAAWIAVRKAVPGTQSDYSSMAVDSSSTAGDSSSMDAVTASSSVSVAPDNALMIADQSAGATVSIKSLTLAAPAWVAIHEIVSGQPGRILGAGYFGAGMNANVTVSLLRNTVAGATYLAMVHQDAGQRQFDAHSAEVTSADGKPVEAQFATIK